MIYELPQYEFRYKIIGGDFTSWISLSSSNAVDNGNGTITINNLNYDIAIGDFQVRVKAISGNPPSTPLTNSTPFIASIAPITPPMPTNPIEDLDDFTFGFTLSVGYTLSQHEYRYRITGESFTSYSTVTVNPIPLPNADIAIGDVQVRVKAIGINNPSNILSNAVAYTEIVNNTWEDDNEWDDEDTWED